MSPKIGKFKKLWIFSRVCSGATRSVTPKFYFTFRCLIHITTIYLKIKKNAKIAFHTPTSLRMLHSGEITSDELKVDFESAKQDGEMLTGEFFEKIIFSCDEQLYKNYMCVCVCVCVSLSVCNENVQ